MATLGLATPALYPLVLTAAFVLGASAPCVNGPIHATVQSVVNSSLLIVFILFSLFLLISHASFAGILRVDF